MKKVCFLTACLYIKSIFYNCDSENYFFEKQTSCSGGLIIVQQNLEGFQKKVLHVTKLSFWFKTYKFFIDLIVFSLISFYIFPCAIFFSTLLFIERGFYHHLPCNLYLNSNPNAYCMYNFSKYYNCISFIYCKNVFIRIFILEK